MCVPSWGSRDGRQRGLGCVEGDVHSSQQYVVSGMQADYCTVGRQRGRSVAESIFIAFPFLLLHTLPSLMHVCSLSVSPNFTLQPACPATAEPREITDDNLACSHCLPACSYHLNSTPNTIHSTRLPRPLQNGNATRHIAASSFEPSKHFLSAHALLHPLPLPLLLSLPKPSHIPLHLLGHCSR